MLGQIIAVLLFLGVAVNVPLFLLLWSRRARMHSGRVLRHDGPRRLSGARAYGRRESLPKSGLHVPESPHPAGGRDGGLSLSSAEREQWEQLVNVSWELPPCRDERP